LTYFSVSIDLSTEYAMSRSVRAIVVIAALLSGVVFGELKAQADSLFGVGFLEAGDYYAHAELRRYLREQLPGLAPAGVTFTYPSSGFKSAGWNRDDSRRMARELASDPSVDLVLALGPWTVEDLLEASFDRPIVAAFRFDPKAEGLIDSAGHPVTPNLTVRLRPGKTAADLGYLYQLKPLKRLGFLHFPSSGSDQAVDALSDMARTAGVELVTAEGFDRNGTFAFFKAFQSLDKSIDALYVSPLWGCDKNKIRSFFDMVAQAGIPVLSAEHSDQCRSGALACGSFESIRTEALYQAWKIARIAAGVPPSDLPLTRPDEPGLTVNETVARQVGVAMPSSRRPDVRVVRGPLPDEAERLTLVDAVQKSLMQNQGYLARYEALDAAALQAGQARASLLPQIIARASLFHFNDNAVNNDSRYEADRLRLGVYLEQEVFSLENIRKNQAVSFERSLTALDQQRAARDLELAVTLAFLECLRTQQTLAQLSDLTERTRVCSQIAVVRDNAGIGSAADAIRWETAWLRCWFDEQAAQADAEIAHILLNGLLGRPGDFPFALDDQGLDDPAFFAEQARLATLASTPEAENALIDRLAGMSRARNLEARMAEVSIELGSNFLSRNTAGFFPRLGVLGSFEYSDEWAEYPGFEEKNPTWSLGARVELPLFLDGGGSRERRALKTKLGALQFERDEAALKAANRDRKSVV